MLSLWQSATAAIALLGMRACSYYNCPVGNRYRKRKILRGARLLIDKSAGLGIHNFFEAPARSVKVVGKILRLFDDIAVNHDDLLLFWI